MLLHSCDQRRKCHVYKIFINRLKQSGYHLQIRTSLVDRSKSSSAAAAAQTVIYMTIRCTWDSLWMTAGKLWPSLSVCQSGSLQAEWSRVNKRAPLLYWFISDSDHPTGLLTRLSISGFSSVVLFFLCGKHQPLLIVTAELRCWESRALFSPGEVFSF